MIRKLKFLIGRFWVNAFAIFCLPLCFCSFCKCSKNEDHSTNEPALTTDREGNSKARSLDSNRNLEHSDRHEQDSRTDFNNHVDTEHATATTPQKDGRRQAQETGSRAQETNEGRNSRDENTDDIPSLAESSVSANDLDTDNEEISVVKEESEKLSPQGQARDSRASSSKNIALPNNEEQLRHHNRQLSLKVRELGESYREDDPSANQKIRQELLKLLELFTNEEENSRDEDTDDTPSLAESSVEESRRDWDTDDIPSWIGLSVEESNLDSDNEEISMVIDATSTNLDSAHASVMAPTDISDCATIEEIMGHEEEERENLLQKAQSLLHAYRETKGQKNYPNSRQIWRKISERRKTYKEKQKRNRNNQLSLKMRELCEAYREDEHSANETAKLELAKLLSLEDEEKKSGINRLM